MLGWAGGWCYAILDDRRPSRRTRTGSRGIIPNPIVLGHDGGRPVAPSTTRATRLRARTPAARRGLPAAAATAAAATVDVPFVLHRFDAVEPVVDVELILAGRAVFAEALALFPAHEPYRVLDELHRGAEDGVLRRPVELRVYPGVGRVRFDALLVQPERVAFREFEEFPFGRSCIVFLSIRVKV